jgi:hypothetical protein
MNKFRPQNIGKRYIIKQRLLVGHTQSYNWQSRIEWYPAGYRVNKKTIARQFARLHYLACHAPGPVAKGWQKAYNNFYQQHFGVYKGGSMRYLNTWSCHAWM